jgi:two-component system sensor kinase FixL
MARHVATALVALAAACSLFSFAGWVFDVPALRGFGIDKSPIWPLTAIGYGFLSLGYLASIFGRDRIASALWVVPVAIALASLFQNFLAIDLGLDLLLFGKQVAVYEAAHPGRTSISSSTIFLLLAVAGYGTRVRKWLSGDASSLFAAVSLALVGVAAVLTIFSLPGRIGTRLFSVSLPATLSAASVSLAYLILHSKFDWVRQLTMRSGDWRTIRFLLPAALILPIIPAALEPVALRYLPLPALTIQALVTFANILIVAFIAYWAVVRVARGQATMAELSEALDQTTVVLTNPDGEIIHWSGGCEQLYGWSAGEAIGRNKYALLRSQCRLTEAARRSRLDDGQELLEICRDGRETAVLERMQWVDSPGRAPVIILHVADITQSVAAVEALKVSEERLAAAASAHELGIFEWDVQSGKLEWSPGTEQRLGLIPGTIGDFERWRAHVEPEDVQRVLDTIARTVRDRADKFSYRYRFIQPQGGVRSVEGSSRAFYDAEGNLVRTVGVILDVTERDEREAALRRREAQLRSVLETVPDAMVVLDQNSTILQFSAAAEALWGYRAADVLGRPATMLVPAERRAVHLAALQYFLKTGEGIIGRVLAGTAEAADGRKFPIEIRTGVARSDGQTLLTVLRPQPFRAARHRGADERAERRDRPCLAPERDERACRRPRP